MFGELLVAVRQHLVTDRQAVSLEILPREVRRKLHKKVDVAVAGEPRSAGRRSDEPGVGLDRQVLDGRLGAVGQVLDDRLEGRPLRLVGNHPVADLADDRLERHTRGCAVDP